MSTNTFNFTHGTITITATSLTDGEGVFSTEEINKAAPANVDHLMSTVMMAVCKSINNLNEMLSSYPSGDQEHSAQSRMDIDPTTMEVKVFISVNVDAPRIVLVRATNTILMSAVPCMAHLMDENMHDELRDEALSMLMNSKYDFLGDLLKADDVAY